MKLFAEIEKTIERGLRQWTERLFGAADSDELLLVHHRILEAVEARIETVQRGRRLFPCNHVIVRLASPDAARRNLYRAAFEREKRLENDLRQALDAAGCERPPGFAVSLEVAESGERVCEVVCEMREAPRPRTPSASASRLVTVRGKTREPEYRLTRARTLIGRTDELIDAEQRVVRRNDVVFEEGADEANATVSRRHAQIRRDPETGEHRIADDGSEYGTRIFRDGRPLDVPSGNRRGVGLRGGDEIYVGRACLRFECEE